MRSITAKILCLLAAFSLIEGQTVVYQAYAWATMLTERLPERGLTEALDSTFSGAEPCPHCKKIAETQSKKKPEQAPLPETNPITNALSTNWKLIALTPPNPTRTTYKNLSHLPLDFFIPDLPAPPPKHA